jgi:diadenosine tetraphosphate (Ap4A) HIT family hydrolase/glutathione S-transferase
MFLHNLFRRIFPLRPSTASIFEGEATIMRFASAIVVVLTSLNLSFSVVEALSLLKMSSAAAAPNVVAAKRTLYDAPVSNNGARCRIILYKKNIPDTEVSVVSPMALGGLKSEEYLSINPQGKMPSMVCTETGLNLAESDTIARYLCTTYQNQGASFQVDNPKSNLMARYHDIYMTTIQGCMYKAAPPFSQFGTRKDALAEYVRQWKVVEDLYDPSQGMYLCGPEVSLADATIFPSAVFANHMLPKFGIFPALPPKLSKWFSELKEKDSAFKKVHDEIMGGMQGWEEKNRWDPILGAGWRDVDPPTLFDKIIAGNIPAEKVMEDDHVLAFKDINPAAPAHVLVIPKDRNALTRFTKATAEHTEILGKLMVAAAAIARDKSLGFGDGARIVVNDGPDGGQEVMHLHVHVLGGRHMTWPPG